MLSSWKHVKFPSFPWKIGYSQLPAQEISKISITALKMVTFWLKVTIDSVVISEILLMAVPVNHCILSNKNHMAGKGILAQCQI